MFYLDQFSDDANTFVSISYARDWEGWLSAVIPTGLNSSVRNRLRSNLKHVIVGVEMKAALLLPHFARRSGNNILFEPYATILTLEFCIGTFSVCEGIGAALYLSDQGDDGSTGTCVRSGEWLTALSERLIMEDGTSIREELEAVKQVRDIIHQDRLALRQSIDWHDLSFNSAFVPAARVWHRLLQEAPCKAPTNTNLNSLPITPEF